MRKPRVYAGFGNSWIKRFCLFPFGFVDRPSASFQMEISLSKP